MSMRRVMTFVGTPCSRQPGQIMRKANSPTGRRNHDRPLKGLQDTWDRNGSKSGPTAWQIWWWWWWWWWWWRRKRTKLNRSLMRFEM